MGVIATPEDKVVVPASQRVEYCEGNPLETLRRCGGYYKCPYDAEGNRLGPLVGYAGTYTDEDGVPQHYVGDVYYNVAAAEQHPRVIDHFATCLSPLIAQRLPNVEYMLGAPMGGLSLANFLAMRYGCCYAFAEKEVTAVAATADRREESRLVLKRCEIEAGSRVIAVDDVCNNYSTTDKIRHLLQSMGAQLVAIACLLNRSAKTEWNGIPVISLIHVPTQQWEQHHPDVADDIQAGNVAWNPKAEWPRLMAAMAAAGQSTH